jgi:hypothetical protein
MPLTDQRIAEISLNCATPKNWFDIIYTQYFARAIEAEVSAPLLERIEELESGFSPTITATMGSLKRISKERDSLQAKLDALTAPVSEPVAWIHRNIKLGGKHINYLTAKNYDAQWEHDPLYSTPQPCPTCATPTCDTPKGFCLLSEYEELQAKVAELTQERDMEAGNYVITCCELEKVISKLTRANAVIGGLEYALTSLMDYNPRQIWVGGVESGGWCPNGEKLLETLDGCDEALAAIAEYRKG